VATLYGSEDHPIIEVLIDGVWTDVSTRVRNGQRIDIQRGRANAQGRAASQRASMTLDNADGYFSTRLPTSVNYGKIGKNTQIRVSAGRGDNHLKTLWNDTGTVAGAVTADKASLDITGDIDIRADIWPHAWRTTASATLANKWLPAGDQRSWTLRLTGQGKLILNWATAGTTASSFAVASDPITPPASGRLSVRVTLDVDSGGGNRTLTFYTGTSITGPWTTLGSPVVQSGTTSIYASSAEFNVARGNPFASTLPYGGKVFRFQVYDGIDGTLVADFDPGAQSLGATSWSDGLASANTWTISGDGARVTSDRVRFWGELSSLPKQWDSSGTDVTIPASAAGMLQRLSQGVKPFDSPMTRNFKALTPFAWWPLEDGSDSTSGVNLAGGTDPSAIIYTLGLREARLGDGDAPPGATSSLAFSNSSSRAIGNVKLFDLALEWSYIFYIKVTALPASDKTFAVIYFAFWRVEIGLSPTAWSITWYDITNTQVSQVFTAITDINPNGAWVGYSLNLEEDGSDLHYTQRWDNIGSFGGTVGPTTITGGGGFVEPRQVWFLAGNDAAFNDMRISHVFASTGLVDVAAMPYRDVANAYQGETAATRLARLAAEEDVPMEITGRYTDSEPMGYQATKTLPDLIAECWETDGGIGGEARDTLTLEYRTRANLEARDDATLSHSLSDLAEAPNPTDDDIGFTNDVTVIRDGGSSFRSIVTEGLTSISDPPAGVGRYATETTLNLSTDDRLPSVAGWLALSSSWDQDRYPSLIMALHRARLLADDGLFGTVAGLNLGDTATLTGLPAWMPPDDVPQIVQGYSEQLSRFLWEVQYNCSPGGPYQATVILENDTPFARLDATEHTIGSGITTTGTSLSLVTPTGSAVWADSAGYAAEFPIPIAIGGEEMSLTAVTGTSSPQTGTVVRSVNGVVKTHDAGALVRLAHPFYVAR
jgi:hypothetical protein